MKKIFLFWPVLLIAAVLFTSCSTTITKRHYRKGYYVHHKQRPVKAEAIKKDRVQEALTQANASEMNKPIKVEESTPANEYKTIETNKGEKTDGAETKIVHQNKKKSNKQKVERMARVADKFIPGKYLMERIPVASAEKNIQPEAGLIAATLSLFWVVIVVLLVLYLIGILFEGFGIGGLFHLMAVIILILLILWLLGIV